MASVAVATAGMSRIAGSPFMRARVTDAVFWLTQLNADRRHFSCREILAWVNKRAGVACQVHQNPRGSPQVSELYCRRVLLHGSFALLGQVMPLFSRVASPSPRTSGKGKFVYGLSDALAQIAEEFKRLMPCNIVDAKVDPAWNIGESDSYPFFYMQSDTQVPSRSASAQPPVKKEEDFDEHIKNESSECKVVNPAQVVKCEDTVLGAAEVPVDPVETTSTQIVGDLDASEGDPIGASPGPIPKLTASRVQPHDKSSHEDVKPFVEASRVVKLSSVAGRCVAAPAASRPMHFSKRAALAGDTKAPRKVFEPCSRFGGAGKHSASAARGVNANPNDEGNEIIIGTPAVLFGADDAPPTWLDTTRAAFIRLFLDLDDPFLFEFTYLEVCEYIELHWEGICWPETRFSGWQANVFAALENGQFENGERVFAHPLSSRRRQFWTLGKWAADDPQDERGLSLRERKLDLQNMSLSRLADFKPVAYAPGAPVASKSAPKSRFGSRRKRRAAVMDETTGSLESPEAKYTPVAVHHEPITSAQPDGMSLAAVGKLRGARRLRRNAQRVKREVPCQNRPVSCSDTESGDLKRREPGLPAVSDAGSDSEGYLPPKKRRLSASIPIRPSKGFATPIHFKGRQSNVSSKKRRKLGFSYAPKKMVYRLPLRPTSNAHKRAPGTNHRMMLNGASGASRVASGGSDFPVFMNGTTVCL